MRPSLRNQLAEAQRSQALAAQRADQAQADVRRLQAAVDMLPVGAVVADEHGTVVFRNRHGVDLAEARGADVLVAKAVEELLTDAPTDKTRTRTLELHGPPPRTLVVSAEPIIGGTVVISEDISSRRRLDATRRDFVANVSHELRTPVGALSLLAEALVGQEDATTTRRLASRIAQETERLNLIIEDLLDLSRIEGELPERAASVVLGDVVAKAVERVQPVAIRREVPIRAGEAPAPVTVIGDESQLVSALVNLLDNAVKYSEAGSHVEVDVHLPDVGWVDLVVRDHGIGIPSRDLERIFERFYRVDRARSRQTGGTGLGLAIVRHVATNHSGEILVRSTEGEGSTFTLRLPSPGAGTQS